MIEILELFGEIALCIIGIIAAGWYAFACALSVGIFMLIAHWWGMTAAITVIAIECVLALWTVYEMRHASDEPVDE